MAADETNRFLFLDETGKSVQFYMPSCPERKTLRPIIESGGGEISNKIVPGCIKLARPGQKVHSDDLINCKYVTDCVEQDELLDVKDYRIPADTVASDEGDKVSDIEMDIDNHIMNLPPRAKKGRTKYLLSEDLKIIRYILDEELYNETSGNAMWQEMGILKIVNHTWQSMRDHFLKVIVPNIRSYQLNSREIALLTQTAATNWDKESGHRASKSPSPKKATTSTTCTESSPPKKKVKRASSADDSDSASTLAPDIPVVFDNLDRELLALAMDEDPGTKGSDQGQALSEDKEPAPCEVVQIQSTSKKRQRLARASTITTSTATSTTSPEKTQTESPTSPAQDDLTEIEEEAQDDPSEKEEEDITKESDGELMPGQPFKSPAKKVPASEPAESVIVVLDPSDDEEYEESQSVLEPQPKEKVRELRSRDVEASKVSNRNNNATTASTGQEKARPKRATRSRIDYLKNFVHDPVSSQPETQQIPSSPESEDIDQQHLKKIERKVDKVCQWLSIRREELLDVLWTTSGSLDDAVNWILSGGSDLVPVWTPDDDMMLQGGDERDLCELEGKFGPTGIDTRLSFTAETSS